ncbi:Hypothetical predicted protein, partial [Paramuricea clavata]
MMMMMMMTVDTQLRRWLPSELGEEGYAPPGALIKKFANHYMKGLHEVLDNTCWQTCYKMSLVCNKDTGNRISKRLNMMRGAPLRPTKPLLRNYATILLNSSSTSREFEFHLLSIFNGHVLINIVIDVIKLCVFRTKRLLTLTVLRRSFKGSPPNLMSSILAAVGVAVLVLLA